MNEVKNKDQGPTINYVRHNLRSLFLVVLIIVVILVAVKIIDHQTNFLLKIAQLITVKK